MIKEKGSVCMSRMWIVVSILSVIALMGCARLKEGLKGFMAVSTRDIENARQGAIIRIVDYDYRSCYKRVENRLIEIGSSIYAKREDFIAVYISQRDTTPAGVFFKEIDSQKTQLEIASPAVDTKEYLAEKIFSSF